MSSALALESARIDGRTALVASPHAPLADQGGDRAAVWCAVPERPGPTLVYLHGNDQFVTASASAPGGYVPDWAPATVLPVAVGPRYGFATLGAFVVVPEIGVPRSGRGWSVTAAGAFARTDRDGLALLLEDVRAQLAALGLDAAPGPLVVAAHSGGGRALAALLASPTVRAGPAELWLLDATYGWGEAAAWAALARGWGAGRPGGVRSRIVVAWIEGTSTDAHARAILEAGRALGMDVPVAAWGDGAALDAALAADAALVGIRIPYASLSHDDLPAVLVPRLLPPVGPR